MPLATTKMGLEMIVLREASQTVTFSYDAVYVWNLKMGASGLTTHRRHRKQAHVARGERLWEG